MSHHPSTFWGYHLMLDCSGCNPKAMASKTAINRCLKELITKTNMKALGKPIFRYIKACPETVAKAIDGYSVVQIIQTSSITMHFVDSLQACYIDFFSCKDFDVGVVKGIIEKHFGCKKMRVNYITRQA